MKRTVQERERKMTVSKLNLRQNAMHTLYHAVEHLYWSESDTDSKEGRSFDHDEHTVEWRNERGHLCFPVADFTRLPSFFNLKFALLHLIQAAELLLKAHVEQCEPAALFVKAGSQRTIDLRTALKFALQRHPTLLSRREHALLLEAKDIRNRIEHYEFDWAEARFRTLCTDFLAVCVLLSQALLSVNVVDAFSWDYLRDKPDVVAHYFSGLLARASKAGRDVARRSGDLWASANPDQFVFLCLNCGARAVSRERAVCMGCGSEGDEELVALMAEFEASIRRITELGKSSSTRLY
jgi:hypothetical protein